MNDLLKFITCGSVDDGKSTLIGHMLYDAKMIFTDQEQSLILDSKVGSREGMIDYSLLLDGLMAEREQGITIDVAYRYFKTEKRSFIVADTPGHEQYTRNMAVGASFADLAILLVDASQGYLPQTKRHARICNLMGIRDFVVAINKIDLIHYQEERFENIKRESQALFAEYDLNSLLIIPVSATEGDNITKKSEKTPWYDGPSLLTYLEEVQTNGINQEENFAMFIQRVSRPNYSFRGFQGQVSSGIVSKGMEIMVLPSGQLGHVKNILVGDMETEKASTGQGITIQLDEEIDISRGDVITSSKELLVSDMFTATVLWMDEEELYAGRTYSLKIGTKTLVATVLRIKHKVDIHSGEHVLAEKIFKNEIGRCDISLSEKVAFEAYNKNKDLGSFILIDRISNKTSGCGTIDHGLRRSENVIWQELTVTKENRSKLKGQKPKTLWFTGLSGSGKTTLANEIEKRLHSFGIHTMLLDGDNIRHGLSKDLGFNEEDRVENIRRIAEVSKLMNDAGIVVLTSFISPFERDRQRARDIVGEDYIEIYVSTSLEECERRDYKGLYEKARRGEIPNFTGIQSPYEVPMKPEIVIDTEGITIEEVGDLLMAKITNLLGLR